VGATPSPVVLPILIGRERVLLGNELRRSERRLARFCFAPAIERARLVVGVSDAGKRRSPAPPLGNARQEGPLLGRKKILEVLAEGCGVT